MLFLLQRQFYGMICFRMFFLADQKPYLLKMDDLVLSGLQAMSTQTPLQTLPCGSLETLDPDLIRNRVQAAGVVGAGGAGFPTYVKLKTPVDIYLVNAAECEPMLKVDQQLIPQQAGRLIRGLLYGMAATGAEKGIIALKEKYQSAISALTPLLPPQIHLHILPDIYPAGDEVITIWMATGRRVPPAGLPGNIGVMVNNVQTLLNVARAVEQQYPVTRRTLTVNGAVARPLTFSVPLGVTLKDVLALAGGATIPDPAFINGGPMMGKLVKNLDDPVTKTTGGLLVLPQSHPLIRRRMSDDRSILAMARTVCEQCRLCTELCPRHLIGHELAPHLIVRAVNYPDVASSQVVINALICSECNLCESVACPVDISPMRINIMLKNKLRSEGVRYEGAFREVDPMAEYRMIPTKRLINKLELHDYYHEAPFDKTPVTPERVVLPLRQHIGAAAQPSVTVGTTVTHGQCIAAPPDNALGAPVHASISGQITHISENSITITRG